MKTVLLSTFLFLTACSPSMDLKQAKSSTQSDSWVSEETPVIEAEADAGTEVSVVAKAVDFDAGQVPTSNEAPVVLEKPQGPVFPVTAEQKQNAVDVHQLAPGKPTQTTGNEEKTSTQIAVESIKRGSGEAKEFAVGMWEVISMREFWSGLPDVWVGGLVGARDWTTNSLSDLITWSANAYSDRDGGPRGKHFDSNVQVTISEDGIEKTVPLIFNTDEGGTKGRCLMVQKHSNYYVLAMFSRATASGKYISKSDFLINDRFQNLVVQIDYKIGTKATARRASVVSVSSKQMDAPDLVIDDPLTKKGSSSTQSIVYVDGDLDVNRQLLTSQLSINSISVDGKYKVQVSGHFDCKFSSSEMMSLD